MTTITFSDTAVQTPFDDPEFDEAQLAAVSFLARYNGRTLEAYRQDLRGFFQWAADHEVPVLAARLEQSIAATTVVPVSDALLTTAAKMRHACRQDGHALHEPIHANDLWIAASAVHIGAPLLTADEVFEGVPGLTLHR